MECEVAAAAFDVVAEENNSVETIWVLKILCDNQDFLLQDMEAR